MILHGFFPSVSLLCWRGCGQIGDHSHIFWDCQEIKTYWTNVRDEIFTILGIYIPLKLSIYILGCISTEELNTSRDKVYLVNVMLLIARKMITVSWKKTLPPTLKQWTCQLKDIYIMEKLTAQLRMKSDLFTRRWLPVELYLESKQMTI